MMSSEMCVPTCQYCFLLPTVFQWKQINLMGLGKSSPLSVQFNCYVYSSADREETFSLNYLRWLYHVKARVYDYSNHAVPIEYTKVLWYSHLIPSLYKPPIVFVVPDKIWIYTKATFTWKDNINIYWQNIMGKKRCVRSTALTTSWYISFSEQLRGHRIQRRWHYEPTDAMLLCSFGMDWVSALYFKFVLTSEPSLKAL